MLGAAQALAHAQGSKALRVTARIAFDSGQRMTTEAVIFILDSGTERVPRHDVARRHRRYAGRNAAGS